MNNVTSEERSTVMRDATLALGLTTVAFAVGIISPLPASASANWGEEYDNGSGMTVCICDDKLQECAPCFVIPPAE